MNQRAARRCHAAGGMTTGIVPIPAMSARAQLFPVILAIDDDPGAASALEADLPRRYAADYRVMVERSPEAGLRR